MLDLTKVTTDELRDLLAECLRGLGEKRLMTERFFREGLSAALEEDASSISITRQIHAAGLLTFGDLSAVEVILDNMMPAVEPGHATGICIAAASTVLSAMLPLPSELLTHGRTVVDTANVRGWFHANRDALIFDPDCGRFRFKENG